MTLPCFVLVAQAGELEIKAILLATSIRRFEGSEATIIVAVPQPRQIWGELSESANAALARLQVSIQSIENPFCTALPHCQ